MIRNEDGLLPGEVILLDWLQGKELFINDFPDLFDLEFGIDPEESLNHLLEDAYLSSLDDLSALNYWSLYQLNEVLEENGLSSCQIESNAIIVIQQEFTAEYIENIIEPGMYLLTNKGQTIVQKYTDFLHQYWDTPPNN